MWRIADLSYQLWEQQTPIYDTVRFKIPRDVNEVVLLCARQFGKSHIGVLLAVEDCLRYPNRCILIIGPTLKQTVGIVTPRLREICRDAPPGLVQPQKSEAKWIIGQSELVIGGMDLSSSSQRGKTLQNVYVEEIVDSKPDNYLEALRSDIGPALTHSDAGKIFFLTTPPKVPDHPFLVETVPKAEMAGAIFRYTIYQNDKLSTEQFRRCAELAGCKLGAGREILHKTVDWMREYECEVVRDARVTVVPEFNEAVHVRPAAVPPAAHYETWVDWGGVRDKTVGLLTMYNFHENRAYVVDERVFGNNTPTSEIVRGLREMEAPYKIYQRWADCPGQLYVDLQQIGYDCRMPLKDDWQAAVNNLNVCFRLDQIYVDPRCRFLITSLNSGQFNDAKTDFARSEALGHLDAVAACMYFARSMDKTSPYPPRIYSNDMFIRPEAKDHTIPIAEAIQPKAFTTGIKRFGVFRSR